MSISNIDKRWLLSRRALLGGVSTAVLASVLTGGRRVRAQQGPAPKRIIFFYVPEGMWAEQHDDPADGVAAGTRVAAPRPVAGAGTLGPMFEPLDGYRSRITVLNKLHNKAGDGGPGDGHKRGLCTLLTCKTTQAEGIARARSFDAHLAAQAHIGENMPKAAVRFSVRKEWNEGYTHPFWAGSGNSIDPLDNPWNGFNTILGGVNETPSTPGQSTFDPKRSILDHSLAEMGALRSRLPAADRVKLETYQDSVRDLERRLEIPTPEPGSSGCDLPSLGDARDPKEDANFEVTGRRSLDIIVAAMQCGLTNIGCLQWSHTNDQCTYPFVNANPGGDFAGVNTVGHDLAHNNHHVDSDGRKKIEVQKFYARQAKHLLDKLAAIPDEGGGTMLDNTLVLWFSEFGESNYHLTDNLLMMMMGMNGTFPGGRVLQCNNQPVDNLLTSIQNAFGVSGNFGDFATGPLSGLT